PLTSLVLWPVFAVFGPEFRVAQAVGVLLGSLLVLLAMAVAAAFPAEKHRPGAILLAGAFAALNPLLIYQAAVPDSAVMFSLTAGGGLLLLGTATGGEQAGGRMSMRLFAAGLLLGLGYLARSDGLLLLPVGLWFARGPQCGRRGPAMLTAGFFAAAAPWWLRQTLTFGSPFPASALLPALVPDYPTLFSWPTPTLTTLLAMTDAAGLPALRWEGLRHNFVAVLLPALGAVTPFLFVGLRSAWTSPLLRPTLAASGVLFLGGALFFPVPTMAGTFYHSLGAALPALIAVSAAGMVDAAVWWEQRRGWRRSALPLLAAGVLALTGAQATLLVRQAAALHAGWERQFAAAGRWLSDRGATGVMTTQPHTLTYATGIPSLMLPAAQAPDVALSLARQYGVRYLLLTERFGRYPAALTPPPPGFRLALDDNGMQVYEMDGP
ncbi:MAG: hypothetical protein NTZ05_07860, partial [Chloroflexi bacterium]|nr:hypothetical protein [Chloroflexota bacterium]